MQGTLRGNIKILNIDLHFGQQNSQDHSELSFYEIGDMHNPVSKTLIKDDRIEVFFDINGFDAKLAITKSADQYEGHFSLPSIGLEVDTPFELIDPLPHFCKRYVKIPEANIAKLKAHDRFIFDKNMEYNYELGLFEVKEYFKSVAIDSSKTNDLEMIKELMTKLCARIRQDGSNFTHDHKHSGPIEQYKWAINQGNVTNCRGLAMILAGLLRSYGFKAAIVECRPFDEETKDLYVVLEVYVESLKKTIALDPSNNTMYKSYDKLLSLYELRCALIRGEAIELDEDAHHGDLKIDVIEYLAYMSKNLFYFVRAIDVTNNSPFDKSNTIALRSADQKDLGDVLINTNDVREFYYEEKEKAD